MVLQAVGMLCERASVVLQDMICYINGSRVSELWLVSIQHYYSSTAVGLGDDWGLHYSSIQYPPSY